MLIYKKRSITSIWKDVLGVMRRHGFNNVGYAGYPADRWQFNEQNKSSLSRKLFNYNNKPFSGGLSSAPAEMSQGYFSGVLPSDPLITYVEESESGNIISSDHFYQKREYQLVNSFFKDWNTAFRVVVPLPTMSEHWRPVLSASGGLNHREGRSMLAAHSGVLMEQLLGYNLELMLHHRDFFNPFRAYQVFSQQAQDVLRLISSGFTNKEAAEHLGLTQDGIKYHLKTMRHALGARNIAELVALSKDLQII